MPADSTSQRLALAQLWLDAQGLGGSAPSLVVDAEDDMARADVQGCSEVERLMRYLASGRESWLACRNAASWAGVALEDGVRVLDFACGYGRFLRWLRCDVPGAVVAAGDLLGAANEFVAREFGVEVVPGAYAAEELRFGEPYDLIWVGSLFSHLELEVMPGFLRALLGALSERGVLMVTTHNPAVAPEGVEAGEFGFLAESESRRLPKDFYGTSYIAPERFRRLAVECGAVGVATRELEVWNVQDLHVLSRRALPEVGGWGAVPFVRGEIVGAGRVGGGIVAIGGHVEARRELGPIEAVRMHVAAEGGGTLSHAARIVGRQAGERGLETVEWVLEGPLEALPEGPVVMTAELADGVPRAFGGRVLERRDFG